MAGCMVYMAKRPPRHEPTYAGTTTTKERHDRKRGTASQRGYTSRWRRAAKKFLQLNPLCEECRRQGRLVAAEEVDHIKPHRGDHQLFWDSDNWQALCKPCHLSKTARGE
jgi:5-methylcytosine-specific restriction enzyme A